MKRIYKPEAVYNSGIWPNVANDAIFATKSMTYLNFQGRSFILHFRKKKKKEFKLEFKKS